MLFLMGFSKKRSVSVYGGDVIIDVDPLYVFSPDANPAF
jgi:hypothetical protein